MARVSAVTHQQVTPWKVAIAQYKATKRVLCGLVESGASAAGGNPVNGDSKGSAALEIASCLVYAYRHNPIIQARKMANPEHLALLKQGVEVWNTH